MRIWTETPASQDAGVGAVWLIAIGGCVMFWAFVGWVALEIVNYA